MLFHVSHRPKSKVLVMDEAARQRALAKYRLRQHSSIMLYGPSDLSVS